jgi:SAM-dependent methyltransferase
MAKPWFECRKQHEPTIGLPSDLLRDKAQISTVDGYLKPLLDDRQTVRCILKDQIPIPATSDRVGYFGERHLSYWLSGYRDYLSIKESIPEVTSARCILDFGGGTGRVARHFVINSTEKCQIIVADLDINHVDYIAKYFPSNVVPLKLSMYPQVMLPDSSCDLVCAFSVFTHIDTYELSWLAELTRVLRPMRYAYITLHTEHTWKLLSTNESFRDWFTEKIGQRELFNRIFEPGKPMPQERLVFEYDPDSAYDGYMQVFHRSDYLKRQWGRFMSVHKVIPPGEGEHHSAVILQKRH